MSPPGPLPRIPNFPHNNTAGDCETQSPAVFVCVGISWGIS